MATENKKPPRTYLNIITHKAPDSTERTEDYCEWCGGPCIYKLDPAEGEGLDYRFKRVLK